MSEAGAWWNDVVRARHVFCQVAVENMGHAGAEVARLLGVTTFAVNRLAAFEGTAGIEVVPKSASESTSFPI